jgi:flavin-dependent dehydrogenase
MKCVRLARAVRQSIVLQQELLGLRLTPGMRFAAATAAAAEKTVADALERAIAETPDRADEACEREDLRDRDDTYDYDDRSYGEVVESIRAEFKIPADAIAAPKSAPAGVANAPTIRRQIPASGAAVPNSHLVHGPP